MHTIVWRWFYLSLTGTPLAVVVTTALQFTHAALRRLGRRDRRPARQAPPSDLHAGGDGAAGAHALAAGRLGRGAAVDDLRARVRPRGRERRGQPGAAGISRRAGELGPPRERRGAPQRARAGRAGGGAGAGGH